MVTMNICLPDEIRAFVEAEVVREGHPSASDYLLALVREAQNRRAKQDLEAKLLEAIDSGPGTPMTREDWDSLERRVWERHHQETPSS